LGRTLCRIELAVLATLLAVVATLLPTFFFAFMIERPALAPTLPRSPLFFGVVSPSAMAAGAFLLVCAKRWFCAVVRRWRVQLHSVVGRFVREMRHTFRLTADLCPLGRHSPLSRHCGELKRPTARVCDGYQWHTVVHRERLFLGHDVMCGVVDVGHTLATVLSPNREGDLCLDHTRTCVGVHAMRTTRTLCA
jgi:hypothetical protein